MKEKLNLEKLILDLVFRDNYQPLKPSAIAKSLKLFDEEREVKRTIKRLVKQDRLAYGSKHLVVKPKANSTSNRSSKPGPQSASKNSGDIIGIFRRAAAGFGFVNPQDSVATDRSDDIFIPKHKTLDAAEMDLVRVRISRVHEQQGQAKKPQKPGTSGRIVEVIERHTHRFVGSYREHREFGFVFVDGGVFESGILVGDAGAKNCKVEDKVVIEMVRFPSDRSEGEGVIVEVLGDRGKPGVDTLSVIRQYDLPEEFPEPVLQCAREQAESFNDGEIPADRTDFTQTTVITIDPKTARDFDDAISLEQLENGHWRLGVHIADVSHFVPYRSVLDNEAFQRGTSVYLPDRVIPMLPEIISNNLASLQPDRVRYCMTALIELNENGVPIATDLCRGAIKSAHRFNYEEIDDYLENDQPWKQRLSPEVFQLVRNMHSLAMKLRKRRMDGGAINLVLPEIKIDLDDHGKVAGAHTVENTESHQVIEEFMLAANEAVARRLSDEKLFLLRRVHPQPTEVKLADLTSFVQGLGIQVDSLQDRYELKRVIEESEDMPEQHAIHYAVLRSMQKAIYSPDEIGHYALNSTAYCHFTSPIRRYPDLIIHRAVGQLIDGKKPDSDYQRLAMLGKHCSELEKRAADAERDLTKLKLLNFMADKIGQSLHAVITGVEAFGVFAQGIEIPAEGMIPLANLPSDRYQFDRTSRTLAGFRQDNQFRLGDQIEVKVAVVDPDQRVLEFELVGVKPSRENVIRRKEPVQKQETRSEKPNQRRRPKSRGASTESPARPKSDKGDWESVRAVGPQSGQRRRNRISAKKSSAERTASTKSSAPKSSAHKSSAPKSSAPKSSAHKSSAHKSSAPKSSAHKSSTHKSSAHKSSAPKSSAPKPSAPKSSTQTSSNESQNRSQLKSKKKTNSDSNSTQKSNSSNKSKGSFSARKKKSSPGNSGATRPKSVRKKQSGSKRKKRS